MKENSIYHQAVFLKSAAKVEQLPLDEGFEVAFAGRSNAGKSSALNTLTGIKQLARTSKTPGRTQLMNVFTLGDEQHRLVDLPGYGYAKVSRQTKEEWQKHLAHYFHARAALKGLILLMDVRHPLKPLDVAMLDWALARGLPVHILLTKADKLSRGAAMAELKKVKMAYQAVPEVSVQLFSSLKRTGIEMLMTTLDGWLGFKSI